MSDSSTKTSSTWAMIATGTAVIAVTYGLIRFGYGLYLPSFRAEFGFSTGTAGAIAAGSFAAYCVTAVLAGQLITRGRPRSVLWASGGLAVLGALLVAAAWSVASLTVGVVIGGSAAGAASPALVAAIGATAAPPQLDRAQAVVNSGTSAGIVAGGLAALALPERWRVTWLVFAITAALVTVLVDRRASWPAKPSGRNLPHGAHASLSALLPILLAAMLVGAGSAAVWTFGPDQLTDIGQLSATATALLWCLLGGAGALGAVSGDLVIRIGLRWSWTLGATMTATSTLLLGVAPDVLPLTALALIGFGGGYVALSGVLIIWAARLRPQRAAELTAALFLALTAGQAIGSVTLGLLTTRSSTTTSFTVAACLALASTAAAARSPTTAAAPGASLRSSPTNTFASVAQTTASTTGRWTPEPEPVSRPQPVSEINVSPTGHRRLLRRGCAGIAARLRQRFDGEQKLALQHDALTTAGCARIFTDTASGAFDERTESSVDSAGAGVDDRRN